MIPSPPLPECHIVISVPDVGMQTEKAYFLLDRIKKRTVNTVDFLSIMSGGDLKSICLHSYNCFEAVFPPDEVISDIISSCGALTCRLSGSGSAVFGIFDSAEKAESAYQRLISKGFKACICQINGN